MFSNRLRKLREDNELSQEQLANKLNLSTSTVGMYEQGRRQPDNSTLTKISEIFDVSVDYLLGNTEVKKFEEPYEDELEKILFSKAKELSDDDKRAVINIINAIKKDIDNEKKDF